MTANLPSTAAMLAIDQGTSNTKAVLVNASGQVLGVGSAPVGVTSPRAGWVEQDAERIWTSVLDAVAACLAAAGGTVEIVGVALSTQRESVVGWRAGSGEPLGPVIGWQDSRTADWCASHLDQRAGAEIQRRTGLHVDAMFSAPKFRWLLDHAPAHLPADDLRLGTIDSWLIWRLTGGAQHLCEAGNASRTLLYDVTELAWAPELLALFTIPPSVLPTPRPSDAGFGRCVGVPPIPDGTPILAVLADSHAALYGHGCTEVGMAKATYGTGSSVMTPVPQLPQGRSPVPTTLAWLVDGIPTYALEGNILSSGATLAWAAEVLTGGDVAALLRLADQVPDAGGVILVPAFTGLGAPHWDRDATAIYAGMTTGTGAAHLARAAVDSIGHQIGDVIDVIEQTTGPLRTFRADGGVTASPLVMQSQADLLQRTVEVADVAEISAVGAAQLAWQTVGSADWSELRGASRYAPELSAAEQADRRADWARQVARARFDGRAEQEG